MLLPLLLASATILSGNDGPGVDTTRGASLLRGCQAEVRLMNLRSLTDAPALDFINGAYCIGYLNGFAAGISPSTRNVCINGDTIGNVVRAYVGFMERHPPLLDEEKRLGLKLALEDAFPCPAFR